MDIACAELRLWPKEFKQACGCALAEILGNQNSSAYDEVRGKGNVQLDKTQVSLRAVKVKREVT